MNAHASAGRRTRIPCLIFGILLLAVSFAGCTGGEAAQDPASAPPQTLSTLPTLPQRAAASAPPVTTDPSGSAPAAAPGTTTPAVSAAPPATKPALTFVPGSRIPARDFFRTCLDNVTTFPDGWYEYQYTLEEDFYETSWNNASWTATYRAGNEPVVVGGRPAVHYFERIIAPYRDGEAPLTPQSLDVYYDRASGLTVDGGPETRTGAEPAGNPSGMPVADFSIFYVHYSGSDRYLEPAALGKTGLHLAGSDPIVFAGNETITLPAGTFRGASHFTEHHTFCGSGGTCSNMTEDYWIVPGIPGFAKIVYHSDGPSLRGPGTYSVEETIAELSGRGLP